jgi:hypothetical protein
MKIQIEQTDEPMNYPETEATTLDWSRYHDSSIIPVPLGEKKPISQNGKNYESARMICRRKVILDSSLVVLRPIYFPGTELVPGESI